MFDQNYCFKVSLRNNLWSTCTDMDTEHDTDTDTPIPLIIWVNHIIQYNYMCRCRDTVTRLIQRVCFIEYNSLGCFVCDFLIHLFCNDYFKFHYFFILHYYCLNFIFYYSLCIVWISYDRKLLDISSISGRSLCYFLHNVWLWLQVTVYWRSQGEICEVFLFLFLGITYQCDWLFFIYFLSQLSGSRGKGTLLT